IFFFFQAEDGIRDLTVTGVQTCALPILSFAMGVVSGVTMSFQFGTNWPGYMKTVGNIAGPLLAYEILTAFFLEAAFLGIMLFGRSEERRVGKECRCRWWAYS